MRGPYRLEPARPAAARQVSAAPAGPTKPRTPIFADFDAIFAAPAPRPDEFYAALQRGHRDADARRVQRQALAGMLWSKQFYYFDIPRLAGRRSGPSRRRRPSVGTGATADWVHLNNADVISMPDTWEYPWYAAWDLAFHCVTLALIDPEFAKDQLVLLTREWYMHPNGQLPAYEWEFGDVNPPVHAWAALAGLSRWTASMHGGVGDRPFLERVFHKLMLNFTWWVNRKDAEGRNIFQGGFLGLDNIGIFDRAQPLPTGGQHRPGRRHRLDGDVCAEPDAHRAGAGRDRSGLRGHRHQVLRAFPVASPRR